jgi:hypothetical protein
MHRWRTIACLLPPRKLRRKNATKGYASGKKRGREMEMNGNGRVRMRGSSACEREWSELRAIYLRYYLLFQFT